MTENNEPEWFEIIDNDEKPELRKVSKSLPLSAVLVAALILGAGVITAQTQNVNPLTALNPQATQTVQSNSAPTIVAEAVVGAVATKLPTGGIDHEDDHEREYKDDDEGDND